VSIPFLPKFFSLCFSEHHPSIPSTNIFLSRHEHSRPEHSRPHQTDSTYTSTDFGLQVTFQQTETYFPTSIFRPRQFTDSSYSHPSEYSPPSNIILLPTLFRNLPTTLSDEDLFLTYISIPPENPTTFYLPYFCPSAQATRFKESHKVSRPSHQDKSESRIFKNDQDNDQVPVEISSQIS
jgi:hypothetical protein